MSKKTPPAPGPYEVVVVIDEEGKARGSKGEKWVMIRNADGAIASVYPASNSERTAELLARSWVMRDALKGLDLVCTADPLNPCWDNRPGDIPGVHWASTDTEGSPVRACACCSARAAIEGL